MFLLFFFLCLSFFLSLTWSFLLSPPSFLPSFLPFFLPSLLPSFLASLLPPFLLFLLFPSFSSLPSLPFPSLSPSPLLIYQPCETLLGHLISIRLGSKLTFFSRSLCSYALGLCQVLHIFNFLHFFSFIDQVILSPTPSPSHPLKEVKENVSSSQHFNVPASWHAVG